MRLGTFEWMKSVNRSIILNEIRVNAPISRAQIAKNTQLTPPTVSINVKELMELGIVKETAYGTSSGGRRPTMLVLTNDRYFVVGVDAGSQKIQASVATLQGNILHRYNYSLAETKTNEQFISALIHSIEAVIGHVDEAQQILGIGIAMHGVVDHETGTAQFAPNLGLANIAIRQSLAEHFALPIYVENDARAMAMGEAWFGLQEVNESLVALNIGRGVGAGILVDGKLLRGHSYLAGEIGHMTIDLNGDVCDCGNRGCLQTLTSGKTIAKQAAARIDAAEFVRFDGVISGETVYELALAGHSEAAAIFQEVGLAIGAGLVNLIHMINPERIVLGGGVLQAEQFVLPAIRQVIEERALTAQAKQTIVELSRWGRDATLMGVIGIVLSSAFVDVVGE